VNSPASPDAAPLRAARALLPAVLVGLYLEAMFYVVPRFWLGYSYIQFLFDYAHGPARRSLEGEILRHLAPAPYSIALFQAWANLQLLAAMSLFVVIVWRLARRSSPGALVLVAVLASSPLTFKNLCFDQGRQDVLGVIALEAAVLLSREGAPRGLAWLIAALALPLALVNENLLLLYLPACLLIVALHAAGILAPAVPRWLAAVPLAACAAACLLCLLLPHPGIPREAYHTYLQSKSVQPLAPGEPERWLYSGPGDNFAFARQEWQKFRPRQWAGVGSYLLFGGVLAGAVAATSASLPAGRLRAGYLLALAGLTPGYAVLFLGASDVARWFANLNLCVLLFSLGMVTTAGFPTRLRHWGPLIPFAAFQLALIGGFGVVFPVFDLAGDLHRLWALL